MAHIHTGVHGHDLTISAFIFHAAREPRVLLHRHKTLGVWLQPGGHVETAETPWSAVAHEVAEETGYELAQLHVLQPPVRLDPRTSFALLHPQPVSVRTHRFGDLDHFHTDLAYAFLSEEAPAHAPAAGESAELRWLPLDELDRTPDLVYPDVRELIAFIVKDIIPTWEPVPATDYPLSDPG
jgi:8-oxo-dGTP pyrophosphatase MutT (NUDIX family)